MLLDIDKTWRDSCGSDTDTRAQFLAIGALVKPRDPAQIAWAERLRVLSPQKHGTILAGIRSPEESNSLCGSSPESDSDSQCACYNWPTYSDTSPIVLELREADACPGCTHYVAISYKWKPIQPQGSLPNGNSNIEILGVKQGCHVPADILRRAISYASHYELRGIWIDQVCIDQNNDVEKELGIQSMDMVYQRSSHPISLLDVYYRKQVQVDVLSCLVEGIELESEQLSDLEEVLSPLVNDVWFTRSWTLQESTSGGFGMRVLIQHHPALVKGEWLGEIQGEIELSFFELYSMVAFAWTQLDRFDSQLDSDLCERLQSLVQRFWTLLPGQEFDSDEAMSKPDWRRACNAAHGLAYLNIRQNERVADRLAILANLCNYATRLDTFEADRKDRPLSACAYVLALANHDPSLLFGYVWSDKGPSTGYTWGPPANARPIDAEYREDDDIWNLQSVSLTDAGLKIRGWLWRVVRCVDYRAKTTLHSTEICKSCEHTHSYAEVQTGTSTSQWIWSILRVLVNNGDFLIADMLWDVMRRYSYSLPNDSTMVGQDGEMDPRRENDTPHDLSRIISPLNGCFIHEHIPFESAGTEFEEETHAEHDKRSTDFLKAITGRGSIMLAYLEPGGKGSESVAIFSLPDGTGHVDRIFTPSTNIDNFILRTRHALDPLSWSIVEGPDYGGIATFETTGTLRGHWRIAPEAISATVVLV